MNLDVELSCQIRRARVADAAAMADVLVEAARAGRRGFVPQEALDAMSVDEHAERWTHSLARSEPGRVAYWVAVVGDQVVGFTGVQPTPDPNKDPRHVGQLHGMFVQSDCWGQGIGRKLLCHAVSDVHALRIPRGDALDGVSQ